MLLDLERSRYLAVDGESLELADRTQELILKPSARDGARSSLEGVAQRLHAQGLLSDEPAQDRATLHLEEPRRSFDFEEAALHPVLSISRAGRLLKCAAVAAWWIRLRSLSAITASVARRRHAARSHPTDPSAIALVASAYDRLRPLALTAQDKCLQDSLALVHFMAAEGLYPQWVIGVKTRPFGAHAWVQHGDMVLNDQHEHVRRFTPIVVA